MVCLPYSYQRKGKSKRAKWERERESRKMCAGPAMSKLRSVPEFSALLAPACRDARPQRIPAGSVHAEHQRGGKAAAGRRME